MNPLQLKLSVAQLIHPAAHIQKYGLTDKPDTVMCKIGIEFRPTSNDTCVLLMEELPEMIIGSSSMYGNLYRTACTLDSKGMMENECFEGTVREAVYACACKIVEQNDERTESTE